MKRLLFTPLFLILTLSLCQAQNEVENPSISMAMIASDMDTSYDFYTNIIGMVETGGFTVDESFGKKSGLTGGSAYDVKILKLIDDPHSTEFKLASFGNPKEEAGEVIQDKNGLRYITIYLKSTEAVLQRIQENNIKTLGDTPLQLPNGKTFILIQDPDGLFIELIGN
ncbi:VOC family protein [Muricauda sp. MAR_2010_75]|jgi:catechol 2,3-dioxygenase-like lactoylglutathione lyase family enzyme|uniref:VOC family protein n=1 Tax=Allomuricauda sp. MAR_2010_75 TaxID=1250232 RepID=UPI000568D192|nr:VOC family protein [Muricauda sp. MAR_2010_75]